MKKLSKKLAILLSAIMILTLCACGQQNDTPPSEAGGDQQSEEQAPADNQSPEEDQTPAAEPVADVKVGVIYTVAGLGGASFNDVIHEGCLLAQEELGVTYEYVEPNTIADEETVMDEMCSTGEYDLIICVGNEQKDAVTNVAGNYPDQKFCYIDASVDLPNIANYECLENEGGFLIGALCAMAERDGLSDMFNAEKKFGFLGGVNNAIINRFAAGFMAGARYIDSSYDFEYDYVGGFADTTTAKAMATTMYNNGCDVVFHAAGGSGIGMFNAASELGFIAVGVNTNQNSLFPDNIIASMLKRVDVVAYSAIKSVVDGSFEGGTVTLTLADDGVGYTNEDSNIELTEDIVTALDEIQQGIISGEIQVPMTIEEVLE